MFDDPKLEHLWKQNQIATKSLQRLADEMARRAENKEKLGVSNPELDADLCKRHAEALKKVFDIGGKKSKQLQLKQATSQSDEFCSPPISSPALPALVTSTGERAAVRFLDFFTSNIRNPNTRKAYARGLGEFLAWCEHRGVTSLAVIQPVHVAAYVEHLTRTKSAPTAKQRLSAIRMMFDWLVTGQVVPVNPAHAVRGPKHIVRRGKTPVLTPGEARKLLDSIEPAQPQACVTAP